MHVSIQPPLRGHGCLVQVVALVAALAGLDEHHRPVEALAVRAGECHRGSACASGRAAATVPTHATVVGSIQTSAPTASVGQTVRLRGFVSSGTFPSFLDGHGQGAAWPDVTQPRLFDQLAPGIVVGHPRRNTHPAAPGTL